MDEITALQILDTFPEADLSIIKQVLYFDGWSTYEEYGGYLMFIGIDNSIQRCEYGYCVMVADNTNYFLPYDITAEEYYASVQCMNNAKNNNVYVVG